MLPGALGACLAALAGAACTEPRFPEDAGPPGERWVGRYAARNFMYASDGVLQPSAQQLSVVAIEARGDRYVLEQKFCLYEGTVSFVLLGYMRFEFPESLPAASAELLLEGEKFSTEWAGYTMGFEPEAPPACAPGGSAPARPEQRWLSGPCKCPEEGEADRLPVASDDCRVTDPDADADPAATFELAVSGSGVWTYHALQKVRLRYLNGFRLGESLFADFESIAETSFLACDEADFTPGCDLRDPVPCPPKYNRTEFVEIDDAYDCARVIAERDGLFKSPMPGFPPGCAAGG
jgi:hypothetical protein